MTFLTPSDFEYAPRLEGAIYRNLPEPMRYAYVRTQENGVRFCLIHHAGVASDDEIVLYSCCTAGGNRTVPTEEAIEARGNDHYYIDEFRPGTWPEALDWIGGNIRHTDRIITHRVNIPASEALGHPSQLSNLFRCDP